MEVLDVILFTILAIALWYLTASMVGRWHNSKVAQRCCKVFRRVGDAASLYMDVMCDGLKISLYIKRRPWDNPLNLVAFYILRRRPFVVARFEVDIDLGVMDASRAGGGKKIGSFYLVNTSVPRAIAEGLLKVAETVGAWRISTSGRLVQMMWEGTDCGKAVGGAKAVAWWVRELQTST